MNNDIKRPGPDKLAHRPLHLIWIADCSGSMSGAKIQSLNTAIEETIPAMQKAAAENPEAQVLVRAVKFSHGAQWHVAQPTPVENFVWPKLLAEEAETHMGKALALVAEQLKMPPMEERSLPPVIVLITDGQPTDDFSSGLKALMDQPWGKKARRIAIAIGEDAELSTLQQFIGNPELTPLHARNPQKLVDYIKWISTQVTNLSIVPHVGQVQIPQPANLSEIDDVIF
jgi:uncharacterized protein YegL